MSARNLDKLFEPRSIAVIGSIARADALGAVVTRNLRRAGFAGEVMLIDPHRSAIDGLPSIRRSRVCRRRRT